MAHYQSHVTVTLLHTYREKFSLLSSPLSPSFTSCKPPQILRGVWDHLIAALEAYTLDHDVPVSPPAAKLLTEVLKVGT